MNKGLGLASGDIVLFLNSDDILYDEKTLGLLYNCFAQGNSGIVYGNIEYVDSHNKVSSVWRPGEYYDGNFSNGWSCPHPGFVAKKSLYDRFGGFDESLAIASDFDLMLRFFLQDVKNVYLDITLVKMRDDGISSKTSSIIRGYKEIIGSLKKNKVKFNIFIYTFKRYSPKIKRVLLKNSIRNF